LRSRSSAKKCSTGRGNIEQKGGDFFDVHTFFLALQKI
jgi:hypothetical protein